MNDKAARYLRGHGKALTAAELANFERRFGKLPDSYSRFLLRENGGVGESRKRMFDGCLFYNIGDDANSLCEIWYEQGITRQSEILPVGELVSSRHLVVDRIDGRLTIKGKVVGQDIDDFLRSEFVAMPVEKSISRLIADDEALELEQLILGGVIGAETTVAGGMTLPQYAAYLGKRSVFKVFSENGFDLSGSLHKALIGPGVSLPLISFLVDCGLGIDDQDSEGRSLSSLQSPWIKHVARLCQEGGGES